MSNKHDLKKEAKDLLQDARKEAQNFDVNAFLRGAQLTVVGALRALQNPELFNTDIYRQAALAVGAGIVIRVLVEAPVLLIRVLLWLLSFMTDLKSSRWDNDIIEGLDFITNVVLQVPFFLMSLRQVLPIGPSLDEMFMMSLEWVDKTYTIKHQNEDPSTLRAMYYANLKDYPTQPSTKSRGATIDNVIRFAYRFGRRAALSLAIYLLSFVPVAGRFVLPAASFYTFNRAVGPVPAAVIFGLGTMLPRRYLATFLQSYFASRALMRELLTPYLKRVRFTKEQQSQFFHDREGVLFGFAIGFYLFLKTPLLGVLIYGVAEASTAYLITKITDPPPPLAARESYAQVQVRWTNKKAFLRLPLADLDAENVEAKPSEQDPLGYEVGATGKKYS